MPQLIRDGALVSDDDWSDYLHDELNSEQLAKQKWILPLPLFLSLKELKEEESGNAFEVERFAPLLNSDDAIDSLAEFADELPLIVLNFKSFTDGRSFSQARVLREQYDFGGELRAVGYFIQDQLHYLSRCGVNAFALDDEALVASALVSLDDFSDSYQAACDEPQPLFRRRT